MRPYLFLPLVLSLALAGCTPEPPAPPATPSSQTSVTSDAASPAAQTPPLISEASAALSQKALAAYGAGDAPEAMRLTKEALAASGKNYEALALQGLLTAFDGAPEDGAALIEKALALAPNYVQGHYDMAMALKLGGHYEASIRHFQRVLEKDPQNVWSMYGVATNYADMRDKEHALLWLRKAAALDPSEVKDTAARQDHFQWLRGDADFEALVRG